MSDEAERRYPHGPTDFNGVRDRVVALRCQGHGIAYICSVTGLPKLRVTAILQSEFDDRFRDRDELKRQTAFQIDHAMRPLWEKYEKDADAGRPDRRDAETILKFIDRKCRLFGLDEAVRVDVRQVETLTDDELDLELARHGVRQLESPPQLPPLETEVADAEWQRLPTEEPTRE